MRFFFLFFLVALSQQSPAADSTKWVVENYRKGDFKLVHDGKAADIFIASGDFKVAQIAATNLAGDVERVTGIHPRLSNEVPSLSKNAVIIGTLGMSPVIDALVKAGKLDTGQLKIQWESFLIATVDQPLPNVESALIIVGSDRRGTAYGVYELSQAMGVSPWNWWADVTPARKKAIVVRAGVRRFGPPSVKYRGIFLNDEDWGLQPWAAKTFDKERGDIGPRTYARIFELLLRLKANTLWPAMHKSTHAFNYYPESRQIADDYAIVVGSSHAEPMLRNNVSEWTDKPENFDFTKNPAGVIKYWGDRVAENGKFENVYTLGMRGIHDSAIQGPKTPQQRIQVLEQIFDVQRGLLAKYVSPEVKETPQIFVPYKEVLDDYHNGLKVPDDVTIVFPDDNFGYVRYLPTPEERKRTGGFGVYYHISYLGRPLSYIWLETTPPALIWEEMSKAFDYGVRKFWVVNVGDIKPGEIGTEFFLQMAWDANRWDRNNLPDFLNEWAGREFGSEHASEIAGAMDGYYRLGFARKPEHLQWYLPGEKPRPSEFAPTDYGDEVQARMDAYDALVKQVDHLYALMPDRSKDSFYELVVYPVRRAALANKRFFLSEKCALYIAQGRASSNLCVGMARDASEQLMAETAYYNEKVAGGKWRHIMATEPTDGSWQSMRSSPPELQPAGLAQLQLAEIAHLGVAIEGRNSPIGSDEKTAALPAFSVYNGDTKFIDVFNTGRKPSAWHASSSEKWIRLDRTAGTLERDERINVSIDWAKAPRAKELSGTIEIKAAGETRTVNVHAVDAQIQFARQGNEFTEVNGVVSIEAEHFSSKTDRATAGWQIIPGLGRTGDSMAIFPTTAPGFPTIAPEVPLSRIPSQAPFLEYRIHLTTPGELKISCFLVPTHPVSGNGGLRYAIAIDEEKPQVISADAGLSVGSPRWSQNVLNATTIATSKHAVAAAGSHVLRIYMVDPGVVIDKIVIDSGGVRPSYLGPRETRVRLRGEDP